MTSTPLARWAPWAAGAAAFSLYAATLTPNLALAHDAAGYLVQIESGEPLALVHPHHLLYNAASALWLALVGWTGLSSVYAVALLNAVAGGASVGLVVALLRDRGGVAASLALGAGAGAGVSFGLWFYSVSVEVYVIPLALLLATLYVALGVPSARRALAVGVLHGLAMLFHQVHVLFGVVMLLILWRQRHHARPLAQAARYIAAGSVVVLVGYGVALLGVVRAGSPEAAWTWFTLYAQDGGAVYGLSVSTAAKALVGFVRSVVGGHFAFAMESVQGLLVKAFPDKVLDDETFLVRGLPAWLPPALLALAGVTAAGLVALVIGAIRHRGPASGGRDLRAALVVWIAVYALFFFFWDPFNVEFWIPQTTALWMLVALGLSGRGAPEARAEHAPLAPEAPAWAVRALWGVAALLFAVNGLGVVLPARDADNDVFAARLSPLAGEIGPGDLVVVPSDHIIGAYARLHLDAETIGVAQEVGEGASARGADAVLARIRAAQASGARVAVAQEALQVDETTRRIYGDSVAVAAGRLRAALPAPDATLAGRVSRFGLYRRTPEASGGDGGPAPGPR